MHKIRTKYQLNAKIIRILSGFGRNWDLNNNNHAKDPESGSDLAKNPDPNLIDKTR